MFPVIVAPREWGGEQCSAPGEDHSRLLDRRTSRPLRPVRIRAADGRLVEPEDTVVEKVHDTEAGGAR